MQVDAQRVEAMPLTVTVTMSVAAWRKVMVGLLHTKSHHTAVSNLEWAIRSSVEHIDKATATKLKVGDPQDTLA